MQKGKKTYNWCHKHKAWTIHKAEYFQLKVKKDGKDEGNATTAKDKDNYDEKEEKNNENKVQMDHAYQTIVNSGGRVFP
jgi:hypothetical protein